MNHPERLGKYQITGVLGEGAMGVVYRGFDPDIRRVVALKTIRHHPGNGPEATAHAAARFRNEAQAAGRLMHPGIVGVYDFGDDGRVAYIAMEFVEGHTLSAYLHKKVVFGDADIAAIASQLCEALGHAHEHGVWHRDIKPSNVIMTKSGRVKIADFGIARTDTTGLTMANSVLGTPMYMAPEQFMGKPIDHRVDLYGVGVVLYQLISGRPPFVGPPEALMYKVANEVPMPPSTVEGAGGSSAFDAVIARALAKDAAARWPNGNAFRDAVHRAYAAVAGGGPVPTAVARDTVYALPMASDYAPTERIPPPGVSPGPSTGGSTGHVPAHWDKAVLAKVEAALARHVGPLAAVMVRRTARDCYDLPMLYQRLGEQITQQSAREAFLSQVVISGTGSGGLPPAPGSTGFHRPVAAPPTGGSGGSGGSAGSAGLSASGGLPVSDAWLEQAARLMAAQVGPIAKVVVKRAAERTRQARRAVPAAGRNRHPRPRAPGWSPTCANSPVERAFRGIVRGKPPLHPCMGDAETPINVVSWIRRRPYRDATPRRHPTRADARGPAGPARVGGRRRGAAAGAAGLRGRVGGLIEPDIGVAVFAACTAWVVYEMYRYQDRLEHEAEDAAGTQF